VTGKKVQGARKRCRSTAKKAAQEVVTRKDDDEITASRLKNMLLERWPELSFRWNFTVGNWAGYAPDHDTASSSDILIEGKGYFSAKKCRNQEMTFLI